MVIVSACFLGVNCRYNGISETNKWVEEWTKNGMAVAICPEVLGGMPIPRPPCEIQRMENHKIRIMDQCGDEQTSAFFIGAQKTLEIAKIINAKAAILKERSPSCGFGKVYDGSFSKRLIIGNGLTADLLSQNGIAIFNENQEVEFKAFYKKITAI